MAAEFWSNAVSLLRGRFEQARETKQAGFNGAAATVALHCLEDGRGSQRQNAVLAVCALFDHFSVERAGELSDAITRTADEMRDIIKTLDGASGGAVLAAPLAIHPDGFHQKACITALLQQVENWQLRLSLPKSMMWP